MAVHTIRVRKSDKDPRVKAVVTKKFTVNGETFECDLGAAESEWFDRHMQEVTSFSRRVGTSAVKSKGGATQSEIRKQVMASLANHGLTGLPAIRSAAARYGLSIGDRGLPSVTTLKTLDKYMSNG